MRLGYKKPVYLFLFISQKKKTQAKDQTPVTPKVQEEKIKKKKRVRGLVYLGHIPHGFYEVGYNSFFALIGKLPSHRRRRVPVVNRPPGII